MLERPQINPGSPRDAIAFFAFVLMLSMPLWLLGAVLDRTLLPGLPVSAIMVVCPVTVGAWLCWQRGGGPSLAAFLGQALDGRAMPLWAWAAALGVMPLIMGLSALALIATGTELPAPEWSLSQLIALFALFLIAGLAEELGWTGYATRLLLPHKGVVLTGLVVGGVAAVWHLIPLLQVGRSVDWIWWWALATVSRRVFIVWLYARGGQSVFGASLLHAMGNTSWMMFPVLGSHYDPQATGLITLMLTACCLAVWPVRAAHPGRR